MTCEQSDAGLQLSRQRGALHAALGCQQPGIPFTSEAELLRAACRRILDCSDYVLAWAALADRQMENRLRLAAIAERNTGESPRRDPGWDGAPFQGRSVVISTDVQRDPSFASWRQWAAALGGASWVALPFFRGEELLGIFGILAAEEDAFAGTAEVWELLANYLTEALAGVQGRLALMAKEEKITIQHRTAETFFGEHRKAESALRQQVRMNEALFSQAITCFVLMDKKFRFIKVNEAWAKAYGKETGDFIGRTFFEVIPANQDMEAESARILEEVVHSKKAMRAIDRAYVFGGQPERGITYWDWILQPILDETGEVEFLFFSSIDVTERNRAQEALRQSERKLAEAQRITHVGYWERELATDTITWSEETFRIFGYEPRDNMPLLAEVWEMVHPDDREAMTSAIEAAIAGGPGYDANFRIRRPCGEVRTVRSQAIVIRDAQGKPLKLFGTVQDITEQKKAEALLHAREQEFRALVENAPDYIIRYNRECRRTYVNPAFADLCGRLPSDLIGKQPGERFPDPAESLHYLETIKKVFESAQPAEVQFLHTAKTGKSLHYSVRLVPEFDAEGSVETVLAIGRDISALTEAECQLRTLVENFPDCLARFDLEGRYTYINPATLRISGQPSSFFLGKILPDTIPERNVAEALHQAVLDVARTGTENIHEARWHTPMGMRIFDIRHIPECDEAGHVTSVLGIARDITEARLAEEKIRELNAELEIRVDQRTGELEAAYKELEAFAYSVSHDLRAPLRSIDGFSRILLEDYSSVLDDEGKDSLERICGAANRMGELIDSILHLSRISRSELHRMRVNLSELAGAIASELQRSDGGREMEWIIAPDLTANADPVLMRVALENLLGNGWKFTGKITGARVEFGKTEKDGEPVFYVRDNGAGFDMTYAGRLFSPFQRLHARTEFPGSGVGLASVHRIIHRHGGWIRAESTPGHGATFYFTVQPRAHIP